MATLDMTMDSIERQKMYVAAQQKRGAGTGVVFVAAFLRGIRELGYKSPAWALAELIDNSIQAAATVVEIRFGYDKNNKSKSKPDQLALIDNGTGMIDAMLPFAVQWGGTDRENDRGGFGRFGYGLPSAAVSIAQRYSVFSRVKGAGWFKVTVDIQKMAEAGASAAETEKLLTPVPAQLPEWLIHGGGKIDLATQESGTVVVLEDIDRLKKATGWIIGKNLQTKLLQHFGVIYRNWLVERQIYIEGTQTKICDPLFLTEQGMFFDETPVTPKRVSDTAIEVKMPNGVVGNIRIRAALLPPNFQLVNPKEYGKKGAKLAKRWDVMKAYRGFIVCREGRQIDCTFPDWTRWNNYDYNVRVEIDFDPALDEFFGITTAKQQIVIDDDMWEKLRQTGKGCGGLRDLISDMRKEFKLQQDVLNAQAEKDDSEGETEPRPSEVAMASVEKFKPRKPTPTPEKVSEAKTNLEDEAAKISRDKGKPKEEVLVELKKETQTKKWLVDFASLEEGPFYQPKRLGDQKRLIVNTWHPFYSKVYAVAPQVRSALEVLMFVLADAEIEAAGDRETFYQAERGYWSQMLRHALDNLVDDESASNKIELAAEVAE